MEKIYYNDQYIREFVAELEKVEEKDNRFHIVLDKTAFFSGGENQVFDLGYIENEKVVDVYEEKGLIYHVLEKKPIKIHKLKCRIDWSRRKDYMDQNLAYHILTSCFSDEFNLNVIESNIGSEISTLDIEGLLDEEKIRKVEEAVNLIINDALKVETLVLDRKELKKMKIKTLPNIKEEVRIVKIGDIYTKVSNGIYPSSTIEIRMVKIIGWEKDKEKIRIKYIAGKRAVDDCFKKDRYVGNICRYLNSTEDEAIEGIRNLNEKLKETLDENRKITEEISTYEVNEMIEFGEKIGDIVVVKKIYENKNIKYVNKIATKIVENSNVVALIGVKSEDKVNLIFSSSKDFKGISMNDLLKDSITLIDGKGGGSTHQAQGAGKNNNNLDATLDYAIKKIKI